MSNKTEREIAADILIAALATGKIFPDGGTATAKAESLAKMYRLIRSGLRPDPEDK